MLWLEDDSNDTREDMPFRLLLADGRVISVTDMSRSLLDSDDSLVIVAGTWHVNAAALESARGEK